MFEQDYIMRLIHELVRTFLKLIFNLDIDKKDTIAIGDGHNDIEMLELKKI